MKLEGIKKMKVADLKSLDREVIGRTIVETSAKVADCYNTAFNNPYKVALVVDNKKLVGVVGKSDLAKAASTQIDPQVTILDQSSKTFITIVNTNPVKVNDTDTVEYLLSTLIGKDLDRIVVCDKDNEPVGFIDRFKLASEIEQLAES